jgi:hypothetical protein
VVSLEISGLGEVVRMENETFGCEVGDCGSDIKSLRDSLQELLLIVLIFIDANRFTDLTLNKELTP